MSKNMQAERIVWNNKFYKENKSLQKKVEQQKRTVIDADEL